MHCNGSCATGPNMPGMTRLALARAFEALPAPQLVVRDSYFLAVERPDPEYIL